MKKYITLPYDMYEKMVKYSQMNNNDENKVILEPVAISNQTTDFTSILDIENKLKQILNSNQPEDKKILLYTQLLQRFIDLNRPSDFSNQKSNYDVETILTNILPKYCVKKGLGFLRFLKTLQNISWDNNGIVTVDNQILAKSNIADFISHTVRNVSSKNEPPSFREFTRWLLHQNNIPISFISNQTILKAIHNPQNIKSTSNSGVSRTLLLAQSLKKAKIKENKLRKQPKRIVKNQYKWQTF